VVSSGLIAPFLGSLLAGPDRAGHGTVKRGGGDWERSGWMDGWKHWGHHGGNPERLHGRLLALFAMSLGRIDIDKLGGRRHVDDERFSRVEERHDTNIALSMMEDGDERKRGVA